MVRNVQRASVISLATERERIVRGDEPGFTTMRIRIRERAGSAYKSPNFRASWRDCRARGKERNDSLSGNTSFLEFGSSARAYDWIISPHLTRVRCYVRCKWRVSPLRLRKLIVHSRTRCKIIWRLGAFKDLRDRAPNGKGELWERIQSFKM